MDNISIIIPTLNRKKELYNTIMFLSSQTLKGFEIIIIDQNKFYDINYYKNIQKTFKNLSFNIFQQEMPNASAARNLGAQKAKKNILLFIDDDVLIKNKFFLNNHLKNYKDSKNNIIAGKVIDYPFVKKKRFNYNNFYFFSLNSNNKIYLYGIGRSCNLSVRKTLYLKLNGMDINFKNGAHKEETDFLFRAKKIKIKVLFVPDCYLIHLKQKTGGIRNFNYFKRVFYSMFGDFYFSIKHLFNSNLFWNIIFFLRRFILNKGSFNIIKLFTNILIIIPSFLYALFIFGRKFLITKK